MKSFISIIGSAILLRLVPVSAMAQTDASVIAVIRNATYSGLCSASVIRKVFPQISLVRVCICFYNFEAF